MTIAPIGDGELEGFAAANTGKPQLLVFSATWCGPCKAMVPALDDIAAIYGNDVAMGKIDIEAAPELAETFGVRGVPTLVAMVGGRETTRLVGGQSKTRLARLAEEMLGAAEAEEKGA